MMREYLFVCLFMEKVIPEKQTQELKGEQQKLIKG